MTNTVKVSGFISQLSWEDELQFSTTNLGASCPHTLVHRPFEIEVPVASLRFDPADDEARQRAFHLHEIEHHEQLREKLYEQIAKVNETIKELQCLDAPTPEVPVTPVTPYEDNVPF